MDLPRLKVACGNIISLRVTRHPLQMTDSAWHVKFVDLARGERAQRSDFGILEICRLRSAAAKSGQLADCKLNFLFSEIAACEPE
jgi:hypothetical protein